MALFTDGPINTSGDLQQYESGVFRVANAEGIDTTVKARLAQDEIGTELSLFLRRNTYRQVWPFLWRRVEIDDVVVTAPLTRWHAYKTLALVYRDAYYNQLNDRYQAKWREYERLAADASLTYFVCGAGVVQQPVPKASPPLLTPTAAAVSGASYYLRISWVNAKGQEGAPSDPVQVASPDGTAVVVRTNGSPAAVSYWNVYAGTGPASAQLQNTAPIDVAASWSLPVTGLCSGRQPNNGQTPEQWLIEKHEITRG